MWSCADRPFTSFFLQATREAHFSSPPIRYEATEKILWSSKSYQLYGLNARIMSSLQTAKSAREVQCLQSEACVVTTFCQGFDVRKLFHSWITKYNHFFLPFSFNSSISLVSLSFVLFWFFAISSFYFLFFLICFLCFLNSFCMCFYFF